MIENDLKNLSRSQLFSLCKDNRIEASRSDSNEALKEKIETFYVEQGSLNLIGSLGLSRLSYQTWSPNGPGMNSL